MLTPYLKRRWLLFAAFVAAVAVTLWLNFDEPSAETPTTTRWLAHDEAPDRPVDGLSERQEDLLVAAEASEPLRVPAAPNTGREPLEGQATLSIRLKNGRQPLRGVTVAVTREDGTEGDAMRTDRRGRGRLNVTADTTVRLKVKLKGVAEPIQQTVHAPGPGETKVVVIDATLHAEELSVTFQLLSFPSGAPLANAKVTGPPKQGSPRHLSFTRQTDENGFVTLPWIAEGLYTGEAPRHGSQRKGAPEEGTSKPIVMQLPADAMLFGQIALPNALSSEPLKLAVSAAIDGEKPRSTSPAMGQEPLVPIRLAEVPLARGEDWHSTQLGKGWVRVDHLGNWQITRIRFNGAYSLKNVVVHAMIGEQWRTLAAGLTVSPGDRQEVVDLREGGVDVELQLHYDRGYGWGRSFEISLQSRAPQGHSVRIEGRCNEQGLLHVPRLPLGSWSLRLHKGSSSYGVATIEHSGASAMDVTLSGWVPLRGSVEEATESKTTALILKRGAIVEVALTDDDGRFDLSPVWMNQPHFLSIYPNVQSTASSGGGAISLRFANGDIHSIDPHDTASSTPWFFTGEDVVLKHDP